MSEKCFCHLNGYKVKDADAHARLDALESAGGGKLYLHKFRINSADWTFNGLFYTYSTRAEKATVLRDILKDTMLFQGIDIMNNNAFVQGEVQRTDTTTDSLTVFFSNGLSFNIDGYNGGQYQVNFHDPVEV